jgi:aldehyde:ferredoxin oxidoreductase
MKSPPDRIEEFRRLYKEAYGEEISVEEASEMASRLLDLYRLLMRPLPGENEKGPLSRTPPAQAGA